MNRVDGMQEDAHEFLVGMLGLIESSSTSRYPSSIVSYALLYL